MQAPGIEDSMTDPTEDWLEDCLQNPDTEEKNLSTVVAVGEVDRRETCRSDPENDIHMPSKPHSTPLTLKWLEENYEIAEGVCIPRSALYMHYLDFCSKNDTQPVNAASFGKIIRQQFPQITTRRLGTRGQSKYHYYGIGVKDTSLYYETMYSKKGVQTSGDGKKDNFKQIVAYSPRSKLGTLLPEFPSVKDLKLPSNIPEEKVSTFIMMYRTHCQRILDTVIRANFDEVQSFLLHFWQGMPQHIAPILGNMVIVNLVGVCDSILYKAISGVLMPTVLQALPDSLTQVIRKFAKQLDDWLRMALEELPETLRKMKFDLSRRFSQVLRRQTSLNHLCQASRTVIHSTDIIAQMIDDWGNVDLNSICKQTLYTMDKYNEHDYAMIVGLYREFEELLEDQAPIEAYTEWLNAMVDRCVVKPSGKKPGSLRRIARQFLLMWSCFGTRVIRDMTLHSAPSFGSFHLIHLMFDDYVLYLVENLHSQERANELLRTIKGEETPADRHDDLILPNPTVDVHAFVTSSSPSSVSPSSQSLVPDRQSVITDGREAYTMSSRGSNSYGGGSPDSDMSSSPSHTSLANYDVNITTNVHTISPNENVPAHSNGLQPEQLQSDRSFNFHRYMASGSGATPSYSQSADANGSFTYEFSSSSPQTNYCSSRDANNQPVSAVMTSSNGNWAESPRYNQNFQAAAMNGVPGSHYNYYGHAINGEYDVSSYGYENGFHAGPRDHAHQGVIYQRYMGYTDYYPENDVGSINRKRKMEQDTVYDQRYKRTPNSEFEYQMGSSYARA